jgi:hypothetical protein
MAMPENSSSHSTFMDEPSTSNVTLKMEAATFISNNVTFVNTGALKPVERVDRNMNRVVVISISADSRSVGLWRQIQIIVKESPGSRVSLAK